MIKAVIFDLDDTLYDYKGCHKKAMETFDYVLPLFKKLSEMGIKIAILTDLTAHIQHRKLAKLNLSDYVDVLVTSEEAGCEKPGRQMFDLVLEKLNMLPEEVIMIGDSYQKDIQGAKETGIQGILFRKETAETAVEECIRMVSDESGRK